MPEHGGNIAEAARQWGMPAESWLDLSTGISPFPCPVPPLTPAIWQRLPHRGDALLDAASAYYDTPEIIAVPGSQAAIQLLPKILRTDSAVGAVAIVSPTFAEHPFAWRAAGAQIIAIEPDQAADAADRVDTLLLCNPNNPTGHHWLTNELMALHAKLSARGCWLIVDEAFVDATPELSIAAHAGKPGLVILRSVGKYFGLAGARVGFVLAPAQVRERLRREIGPWAISGPSEAVATDALANTKFQRVARTRLRESSQRLKRVLQAQGYAVSGLTHYFAWVRHANARDIQTHFAREGILIRVFDDPPSFRLGLPGTAAEWRRFLKVLKHVHQIPACG